MILYEDNPKDSTKKKENLSTNSVTEYNIDRKNSVAFLCSVSYLKKKENSFKNNKILWNKCNQESERCLH